MNSKGQIDLGVILIVFIAVLIGTSFLPTIADSVGITSNTISVVNVSLVVPADTEIVDMAGQELLSTPVVHNGTLGVIDSGNYTIDEGVSATTGLKTVRYTAAGSTYDGITVNVTYDYGAEGYIESSGARAVASLIIIFGALAIAVVALVPTLRGKLFDMVKS